MQTLTFDLPNELLTTLQAAGYTPKLLEAEARRSFATALFSRKVLSLGQAAQLAGMNLWEFIPFLSEQGIAVADYDEAEVERELETVEWLLKETEKS